MTQAMFWTTDVRLRWNTTIVIQPPATDVTASEILSPKPSLVPTTILESSSAVIMIDYTTVAVATTTLTLSATSWDSLTVIASITPIYNPLQTPSPLLIPALSFTESAGIPVNLAYPSNTTDSSAQDVQHQVVWVGSISILAVFFLVLGIVTASSVRRHNRTTASLLPVTQSNTPSMPPLAPAPLSVPLSTHASQGITNPSIHSQQYVTTESKTSSNIFLEVSQFREAGGEKPQRSATTRRKREVIIV